MDKVKSFTIDHTKLGQGLHLIGQSKDGLYNFYDLRIVLPNTKRLSIEVLHSLEHLIAHHLRTTKIADTVLSVNVYGCQTGLQVISSASVDEMHAALKKTMKKIASSTYIPGVSIQRCGSFESHNLEGSCRIARAFYNTLRAQTQKDILEVTFLPEFNTKTAAECLKEFSQAGSYEDATQFLSDKFYISSEEAENTLICLVEEGYIRIDTVSSSYVFLTAETQE